MKEIEGNEHIDYFSQNIILDYIDGKLSREETNLFEQQMQQDETLALAVEGIRGFYAQEEKERPYLENLMVESEASLKDILVKEETKMVSLARRRRKVIGISLAACVALLMVFSVPRLLDNADKVSTESSGLAVDTKGKTNEEKTVVADSTTNTTLATTTAEGEAETGPKEPEFKGNADLLKRKDAIALDDVVKKEKPEAKKIDGTLLEANKEEEHVEGIEIVSTETPPPSPSFGFAPKPPKTKEKAEKKLNSPDPVVANDFNLSKKEDSRAKKKANTRSPRRKQKEKIIDAVNKDLQNRNAGSPVLNDLSGRLKATTYRMPGKLYLWVYADEQNIDYHRIMKLGRDIANNTGLKLATSTASTKQFLSQQWNTLLDEQKPGTQDIVWIYYLGNPTLSQTGNEKNKDDQHPNKLNASVVTLGKQLDNSYAALKIVMVDNGNQKRPFVNYKKEQENDVVSQRQQNVGEMKKEATTKNDVYRKLFLGNTGSIAVLNNDPGRDGHQGIFTQNLLQILQNTYWNNQKSVDWKAILKETEKRTKKQSRQLGKTQRMQKRKIILKKSYK